MTLGIEITVNRETAVAMWLAAGMPELDDMSSDGVIEWATARLREKTEEWIAERFNEVEIHTREEHYE
jgi:hypothetical protein